MISSVPPRRGGSPGGPSAHVKLLVALAVGAAAGAAAWVAGLGKSSPLIGWDALVVVFAVWTWAAVWRCNPEETARRARKEDPGRRTTEVVLVTAAVVSLVSVGAVLFGAGHAPGDDKYWQAALAVLSVSLSWLMIHTIFTLKYAELYYGGPGKGIDFNEDSDPQYTDFAYVAFTIGMTFQVSDTEIRAKEIRKAALRHAWLSFPLATVIIAASINLVSGLAK